MIHHYREEGINQPAYDAIQRWLSCRPHSESKALFVGKRGRLKVPTITNLVKKWCADVGLKGNYGSHTLRKTWGYILRTEHGVSEIILSEAFGHSSTKQTRAYLGIQSEEIIDIYLKGQI